MPKECPGSKDDEDPLSLEGFGAAGEHDSKPFGFINKVAGA